MRSKRSSAKRVAGLLFGPLIGIVLGAAALAAEAAEELPDRVQQILPRGGIPAVFDPVFVAAEKASITDDAWVLGVVIEGEAKAYSLNLLNHHEIVNDRSGSTAFAAVW